MDVAEQGQSQVRPSLLQFKKDLKREKKDAVVGYQKNDQTWVWALTVIIHNCYMISLTNLVTDCMQYYLYNKSCVVKNNINLQSGSQFHGYNY